MRKGEEEEESEGQGELVNKRKASDTKGHNVILLNNAGSEREKQEV